MAQPTPMEPGPAGGQPSAGRSEALIPLATPQELDDRAAEPEMVPLFPPCDVSWATRPAARPSRTPIPIRSDSLRRLLGAGVLGSGAALTALCIGLIHPTPAGPPKETPPSTAAAPAQTPLPPLAASDPASTTILLPAIVIHSQE